MKSNKPTKNDWIAVAKTHAYYGLPMNPKDYEKAVKAGAIVDGKIQRYDP